MENAIFRERALEKYRQRQELNVILRLVSPRVFGLLWLLILLAISAVAIIGSIQVPIVIQGKGVVVQQKAMNGQKAQIVVLLLLPTDQQSSLKVGQPVNITIDSTNIQFTSSIGMVEQGVMSPAAISNQVNLQLPASLAQTIAGPSIVASAPVEPMSLAQTYLGSQCNEQVQIGSQSVLSFIPGFNNLSLYLSGIPYLNRIPAFLSGISAWIQNVFSMLKRML